MDLRKVKYIKRYPGEKIIFVSPTKLLDRLEKDDPEFNVRNPKHQIGNRVERAKEFILKNWNNPKSIFEPSLVSINKFSSGELKLSFGDGRHRVLAAEELGLPEVGIEIKPSQEKYFDYMKVKSMNESPDNIIYKDIKRTWSDGQALPFNCLREKSKIKVYIGDWGSTHSSVDNSNYLTLYPGRLWIGDKIISFWIYPNRKDFEDIINQLEIILKDKIVNWSNNISNKIWNNGWKVEIFLFKGEIAINKNYLQCLSTKNGKENIETKLIPIEDYLKSENVPDELRKIHLMSSAEKDMLRKSGKDPLKYYKSLGKEKPLAYKQAIYQEKLIIKFKDFENNIY